MFPVTPSPPNYFDIRYVIIAAVLPRWDARVTKWKAGFTPGLSSRELTLRKITSGKIHSTDKIPRNITLSVNNAVN